VTSNDILHTEYQDFNHIYIDASKTSVEVGFSYSTSHTSKLFELLPEASIFKAETQAIKEALTFGKSASSNKVLVISDHLAIEVPNPSNEIIYHIHNIIISTHKTIEFMWAYGHMGISGNEKVDILANEAITSSSIITTHPYQDLKICINRYTNMWQTSWDEIPITNKLKSIKENH